jgi:hypothetical protein
MAPRARRPTAGGPFRASLPQPVDHILEPVEHGLEAEADEAGGHAQDGEQQIGVVVVREQVVGMAEKNGAEPRNAWLSTSAATEARITATRASRENSAG